MDRLDAMALFVRAAELGSFTAVARQRGIARSVVTRQIAALEARLGAKLMARSTRRLSLTSAGAAYLERCREILALVETAEAGAAEDRGTLRGPIRASVPLAFGLKRLTAPLLEFAAMHPEIGLDLDYTDRRVHLIEDGIDLAIRITRTLDAGDVARKLGTVRMRAVASPEYLARRGRPAHPSELARHDCLGYTVAGDTQSWPFLVEGSPLLVPVRARVNANSGEALTRAAVAGLGVTCQPDFIVEDLLAAGDVVEILPAFPIPELGIYAMLPGNRQVPQRIRALIEFLADRVGPRAFPKSRVPAPKAVARTSTGR